MLLQLGPGGRRRQSLERLAGIWLALGVMTVAGWSFAAGNGQVLQGHVPAAARQLTPVGRVDPGQRLRLAISLPLRDPAGLSSLLSRLYDPASADYHKYLTPAQFTDRFGPTEADYEAVAAFAEASRLRVIGRHPNRALMDVEGRVEDVERALHATLRVYPHPKEARTFFAPDTDPLLNLSVPVLAINGLDDFVRPFPKSLKRQAALARGGQPRGGSGPNGMYMGYDFRAAYAPGLGLTGAGQAVALVEFDGYYAADITNYESQAGLPRIPLQNILLDGYDGTPFNPSGILEVSLDIEMAIAMAPGLSNVLVYSAGPNGSPLDILNQIATDNAAKQISCSWGWAWFDPASDQTFQQFAAQGQSFFDASGDDGADFPPIQPPSDDPYLTQVGGTTLTTSGPRGTWVAERVWSWFPAEQWASSGGVSGSYAIPTWQQGLDMSTNMGSTSWRNFPDVAMVADNIWVVYDGSVSENVGGTSCAAPLWAGLAALMNEQAQTRGQPPMGFLNPALYRIGISTNSAACFHDIIVGNNTNNSSSTLYHACAGYDLCTGWGTPQAQGLIQGLIDPLQISPAITLVATRLEDRPFSPASQQYILTNNGAMPLSWSLANTSAWLNVTPSGGTLYPGGPAAVVTVSLSPTAANLPAGTNTATLWFTNLVTEIVQGRSFSAEVLRWFDSLPSLIQNGGFETGDFSGWTESGNFTGCTVGTSLVHSGSFGAALGPYGGMGFLSQTLPTATGQAYYVSLWLASPDGETPNEFQVIWNGTVLWDGNNLGATGWTNLRFSAWSSGTNTDFRLGFQDDPSYLGLDDVTVTPIPQPNFQTASNSGGAITFSWSAVPGADYQVQYRTDLTHGDWTNLGNILTATNATATASDPTAADRQRFYRVVLAP
ncbi:putative Tripeptidyl-peptidase I [Verrucomicrobia bacterium]|nr:putative Tripeptidyl-peptidase I [Verrucomicrobiota bacterium]